MYYGFKKESRCVVVVEKEKDAMSYESEIYAYSIMSKKSVRSN